MRKMVKVKTVERISPIEGADRIVLAGIGGWNAIVKRGEFHVGDPVLYFEVDTFLPASVEEFAFLSEKSGKTVVNPQGNEAFGHVLKTMKMRGKVSQGLVLALGFGLTETSTQDEVDSVMSELGVFKWEPPLPPGSNIVGPFPYEARKTDSERVQNLSDSFLSSLDPNEWFATEKIDGVSSTFVMTEEGLKVASRNCEVSMDESLQGAMAQRLGMADFMPVGSVIQGEIFGEGIQGNSNPLKMQGTHLMVFTANIGNNPTNLDPKVVSDFMEFFTEHSVPVLDMVVPSTVNDAVEQVDGMKSTINPKVNAEGVVWWNRQNATYPETGDRPNFKAINNKFLMKNNG